MIFRVIRVSSRFAHNIAYRVKIACKIAAHKKDVSFFCNRPWESSLCRSSATSKAGSDLDMVTTTEGHVRLAARPIIGRARDAPIRDFVSLFGVSPMVCAAIYNHMCGRPAPPSPPVSLIHLLWALSFLKTYQTEAVQIGMVAGGGAVSRRTYRKRVWQVLERLASQAATVVRTLELG